jgi:hypothetical protein
MPLSEKSADALKNDPDFKKAIDAYKESVCEIEEKFTQIAETADPAEKIFELENLGQSIYSIQCGLRNDIDYIAHNHGYNNKKAKAKIGDFKKKVATGRSKGRTYYQNVWENQRILNQTPQVSYHNGYFEAARERANEWLKAEVENCDLRALSQSPRFHVALAKFPLLRDRIADAFAEVAGRPAPKSAPVQHQQEAQQQPPRQLPTYDHLKLG